MVGQIMSEGTSVQGLTNNLANVEIKERNFKWDNEENIMMLFIHSLIYEKMLRACSSWCSTNQGLGWNRVLDFKKLINN